MSRAARRNEVADERESDEVISRYVEPHPSKPGPAEWRLKERGVPVWAIIGALVLTASPAEHPEVLEDRAVGPLLGERQAVEQVAQDYGVSRAAVEAAIAYYRRHKRFIDARLIANAG